MRPFQIQVVLIYFWPTNSTKIGQIFILFLGEYRIFLSYSIMFQDFAKFRSAMFAIFITSPLSALRSHNCVVQTYPSTIFQMIWIFCPLFLIMWRQCAYGCGIMHFFTHLLWLREFTNIIIMTSISISIKPCERYFEVFQICHNSI